MEDTDVEAPLVRTPIRPRSAPPSSRLRGLVATVAAAVVVVLLAGTLYALGGRLGGTGGQGPTPMPTPAAVTGIGVPGPQARFVPSAVAAHGVGANGAPVRQDSSFLPGNLVYIVARVQGVQPGERHTLTIRWYVNGQRVIYDEVAYSQTVTADGYAHFQLKLPTGAGVAKLYWDLPAADAPNAEASLAQTVTFMILPVPTVPPEPGITPTPTPVATGPETPVPTPAESGTPTPAPPGFATPTPALP